MASLMPPHWMDNEIEGVFRENNPNAIARAIANSPHILAAIEKGLQAAKNANPKDKGPSHAQFVRQAVVEAVNNSV